MEIENEEKVAGKKIGFIVLVDDDRADNELHKESIIESGLSNKVKCFTHALDAITYFKNCLTESPQEKHPVPDLVLLDFWMPFYNGFELLDEFKKLRDPYDRKKKIKFVMLTGNTDPALSLHAKLEYSDLIIAFSKKPLKPSLLLKVAKKYF